MRRGVVLAVLAAAAIAGCGESEEEKAANTVCDARDDVSQQIDELKGLSAESITTEAVKQPVDAIRDDLKKIADAQGELADDRREEVEAANKAFTSSVRQVAETILRSTSVEEAKTQLATAAEQLGAAYEASLGSIECD